jgi:hypothetical protein
VWCLAPGSVPHWSGLVRPISSHTLCVYKMNIRHNKSAIYLYHSPGNGNIELKRTLSSLHPMSLDNY